MSLSSTEMKESVPVGTVAESSFAVGVPPELIGFMYERSRMISDEQQDFHLVSNIYLQPQGLG